MIYRLAKVFCLCLLWTGSLYSLNSSVQKALALFPKNPKEVEEFTNKGIEEFKKGLAAFTAQKESALSFESTVIAWNCLVESAWAKSVLLSCLFLTGQDQATMLAVMQNIRAFKRELDLGCSSGEALTLLLKFATSPEAKKLSASQKYQLFLLLKSVEEGWREQSLLHKEVISAVETLQKEDLLPYTYKRGQGKEKEAAKEISILNWNVCFFEGGLSMLFGGVLPWQDRIEKVAREIKLRGADIVCLQEVFSREASFELYSLLAEEYAHFYLHIGPKAYGFNSNNLGISSGLFIASKYPIENTSFTPFSPSETPKERNYGFFSLDIKNIARIITTHLQPGDSPKDIDYRFAQVEVILKSREKSSLPTFVCGDFNLENGSAEYQKVIAPYFINFLKGTPWTCLELRDYYWKAHQDPSKFLALGVPYESIDYFLQIKGSSTSSIEVETKIVEVNNPSRPAEALSDHQMLVSYVNSRS